jgi:hypothetical protein
LLSAPRSLDALPDLAPVAREIRHLAPVAGWTLHDPPAARPAGERRCPPGREPFVLPIVARVERRERSRGHRAPAHVPRAPRVVCRRIEIAHDPHTHDPVLELANRVRVPHPRLLGMLARVARQFPGREIEIVSGYRPSANPHAGSRHAHARAIDLRVTGVSRSRLRDFLRTLPNAGVGYYPNSVFVHLDVRDAGEGPARWTDYAGPGERARYGRWPPARRDVDREIAHASRAAADALRTARSVGARAVEGEPDEPGEAGTGDAPR